MSGCCSSEQNSSPKKSACPSCNAISASVSTTTMQLHLIQPWQRELNALGYYFCKSADCNTVYFDDRGSLFNTNALRTRVGIKSSDEDALVCYCYGVSKKQSYDKTIKDYVVSRTKAGQCDCTNRNPSGRCCLKDFPR